LTDCDRLVKLATWVIWLIAQLPADYTIYPAYNLSNYDR
jgi:hypothetical protein